MSDHLMSLRAIATANVSRLAVIGEWSDKIDAYQAIVDRIPTSETDIAPGFDAGVACALDLIPADKQRLSAILHAAYTEEAILQVRREVAALDTDSETTWWLAACSLCSAEHVDGFGFIRQIMTYESLTAVPALRQRAAKLEFAVMKRRFTVFDGVPFVTARGGMQGAYFSGYDWGVEYKPKHGAFFVGTFRPSLGLEDFAFSSRVDEKGRRLSGPVNGSQQYAKCSSFTELAAVIDIVRAKLD